MAENPAESRGREEVSPSQHDLCAECGTSVGDEWVSYRQKPGDPESLVKHFSGIVLAEPVEPQPDKPQPKTRDFRYPEDLGVFFHSWCAPRVQLPERMQKELGELLAKCLIADLEKSIARWAKVCQSIPLEGDVLGVRAHILSSHGRRVFTMTRSDWEQFRAHEGKVIEIDLERTPPGLAEAASTIASLAQKYHVHSERIEVWRYNENDLPQPLNLTSYLVLASLTPRRLNLAKFGEQASTQDSPSLRKYLHEHVFLVRERLDRGRWEPKARALERVVFMRG